MKLIVFMLGLVAGAGGAAAWLLSEPGSAPSPLPIPEDLQRRATELQVRFQEALAEGKRAGGEAEQRLRRELEAYRKSPNRPPAA